MCPANQVNHSIESNNECGMLLNKLTNPLASLPASKSKTLHSLDSNSEQKMRLRSLMLQKNTSPHEKKQQQHRDGRDKIEKQISNFVHEVKWELIISLE